MPIGNADGQCQMTEAPPLRLPTLAPTACSAVCPTFHRKVGGPPRHAPAKGGVASQGGAPQGL
jgi:hypothetical protein